jgi:uncharacterized coiled-coil protein SlyX
LVDLQSCPLPGNAISLAPIREARCRTHLRRKATSNKENCSSGKPLWDQAAINRKNAAAKKEYISNLEDQLDTHRESIDTLNDELIEAQREIDQLKKEMILREQKYHMQIIDLKNAINNGEALKGPFFEWAYNLKKKGMPEIKKIRIQQLCWLLVLQPSLQYFPL